MKHFGILSLLLSVAAFSTSTLITPHTANANIFPSPEQGTAQESEPDSDDESENKKEDDDKKDGDEKKDGKKKKKSKIKPYKDIVTDKAVTNEGVFTTHLVDGKVYFEIPEEPVSYTHLTLPTTPYV